MSQDERDRVMKKLRGGTVDLLVATDVAARGLDIAHLTHVVNFDVPSAPTSYVHRIGRVGRAGREGVAITLAEPREHVLLKNIERLTKQKIHVETLPTVADLRARRLELTRASLRESILEGGLDHFRVVVESLSDEFDLFDIASGAVKMGHEATLTGGEGDEEEIPASLPPRDQRRKEKKPPPGKRPRGKSGGVKRMFVSVGRSSGVRPQDLVKAVTGASGVDPRKVGSIQISEGFSLVEVADDVAEKVVKSLRRATIKGKRVKVRLDQ